CLLPTVLRRDTDYDQVFFAIVPFFIVIRGYNHIQRRRHTLVNPPGNIVLEAVAGAVISGIREKPPLGKGLVIGYAAEVGTNADHHQNRGADCTIFVLTIWRLLRLLTVG